MFRKEMQEKLHRIFGLAKTTYDAPSESFEQDTLFIHVEEAKNRVTQGFLPAPERPRPQRMPVF